MNASKLLAVAFAASIVGSAAMAQTDTMSPAPATSPNDTSAQVQPGETTINTTAMPVSVTPHPTMRVQGMVPADMVYQTALPDNTPVSREEVKAELVAARADGELSPDADNSGPTLIDQQFMGSRTRDEVKNEIALARADNELNTASDNQPVERTFYLPNKTRADVRAETVDAMGHTALSRGDKAEYVAQ